MNYVSFSKEVFIQEDVVRISVFTYHMLHLARDKGIFVAKLFRHLNHFCRSFELCHHMVMEELTSADQPPQVLRLVTAIANNLEKNSQIFPLTLKKEKTV